MPRDRDRSQVWLFQNAHQGGSINVMEVQEEGGEEGRGEERGGRARRQGRRRGNTERAPLRGCRLQHRRGDFNELQLPSPRRDR